MKMMPMSKAKSSSRPIWLKRALVKADQAKAKAKDVVVLHLVVGVDRKDEVDPLPAAGVVVGKVPLGAVLRHGDVLHLVLRSEESQETPPRFARVLSVHTPRPAAMMLTKLVAHCEVIRTLLSITERRATSVRCAIIAMQLVEWL